MGEYAWILGRVIALGLMKEQQLRSLGWGSTGTEGLSEEEALRYLSLAVEQGWLRPTTVVTFRSEWKNVFQSQPPESRNIIAPIAWSSSAKTSEETDSLHLEEGLPVEATSLELREWESTSSAIKTYPLPGWDRYEPIAFLGAGGMGAVFKVFDPRLRRIVALKFLYRFQHGVEESTEEETRHFLREARTQARVDHPNVVKVYEIGEVEGLPYLAIQFIDGRPLGKYVHELALREKVELMTGVAQGLHAVHRLGVIHRDIKPSNILVTRDESGRASAVLTDFGVALPMDQEEITSHGKVAGTPAYMSPEHARGALLDTRSDVYSLGATFYELLSGRPPIPPDPLLLARIQTEIPKPLRTLEPSIPEDLAAIVARCLQKDPAQRYDSALALAQDLQAFLDGRAVQACPPSVFHRTELWVKRNRVLACVAGLLALSIFVGSGLLAWMWTRARAQTNYALSFSREIESLELDLASVRMAPSRLGRIPPEISERLRRLEQEVVHSPRLAKGPGHAALGRAWLALDEPLKAEVHFREALRLGYRSTEVRLGLATAMATRMQENLRLVSSLEQIVQPECFAALNSELSLQARSALSKVSPGDLPFVLKVRAALIQSHFQEAEALLAPALRATPWRQDLRRLWCETLTLGYTTDLFEGRARPERMAFILDELRQAREQVPGDPFYWVKEGELRLVDGRMHRRIGDDSTMESVLGCAHKALEDWDDYVPALALAAETRALQARESTVRETDGAGFRREAESYSSKLLDHDPEHPVGHFVLLRVLASRIAATPLGSGGQDPGASVEALRQHMEQVSRKMPWLRGIIASEVAWTHYVYAFWLFKSDLDPEPPIRIGLPYAEEGLRRFPQWIFPRNARAALLQIRSEIEDDPVTSLQAGAKDLQDCIQLKPEHPASYYNRALRLIDLAIYRMDFQGVEAREELDEAERMLEEYRRRAVGDDTWQILKAYVVSLRQVCSLHRRKADSQAVAETFAWLDGLRPPLRMNFEVVLCGYIAQALQEEGRDPMATIARGRTAIATSHASPSALLSDSLGFLLVEAEFLRQSGKDCSAPLNKLRTDLEGLKGCRYRARRGAYLQLEIRTSLLEAQVFPEKRMAAMEQAAQAAAVYLNHWPNCPNAQLLSDEVALFRAKYENRRPNDSVILNLQRLAGTPSFQSRAAQLLMKRYGL